VPDVDTLALSGAVATVVAAGVVAPQAWSKATAVVPRAVLRIQRRLRGNRDLSRGSSSIARCSSTCCSAPPSGRGRQSGVRGNAGARVPR
jgi:hypothetical protein